MTSLRFAVIYLLALAVFAFSPTSWAVNSAVTKNVPPSLINTK